MGIASGGADTGKLPCHERRFPGGGARLRLRPAGDTELSERCVSGTDHDQGRPEDHRPEQPASSAVRGRGRNVRRGICRGDPFQGTGSHRRHRL